MSYRELMWKVIILSAVHRQIEPEPGPICSPCFRLAGESATSVPAYPIDLVWTVRFTSTACRALLERAVGATMIRHELLHGCSVHSGGLTTACNLRKS